MKLLNFMNVLYYPAGYVNSHALPLQDIINNIRSDKNLESVEAIRATDEKIKKRELKGELANFAPAIAVGNRRLEAATQATGIMQYDCDLPVDEVDYDELKEVVRTTPHVIYAFLSASRKLKFGILTDFQFRDGESTWARKRRFRAAHRRATKYLRRFTDVEFDHLSGVASQLCSESFDPDAFFNPDCKPLILGDIEEPISLSEPATTSGATEEFIRELLQFVPNSLGFHDRFKVNTAVLGELGKAGTPILFSHWRADDPAKLRRDLDSQLAGSMPGYIGTLMKFAREGGWSGLKGKKRWHQTARPSSHVFADRHSVEDAQAIMNRHLDEFKNGVSKILRITCGFGKSKQTLKFVAALGRRKRVLILVPSHKLGAELKQKLTAAIALHFEDLPYVVRPVVTHIRGKPDLCENPNLLSKYKRSIPPKACLKECMHEAQCQYSEQFNGLDNIRICHVGEYYNAQSAMWHGTKSDKGLTKYKKSGWTPDYVIMDESSIECAIETAYRNCRWKSLALVMEHCALGSSVSEAARQAAREIRVDVATRASLTSMPDYEPVNGDLILDVLSKFLADQFDDAELEMMLVGNAEALRLNSLKAAAARHAGIPTLVLDATIDRVIANAAFPGFDFVDIPVKASDKILVYQLQNANLSKGFLKDAANREKSVEFLRRLVEPYQRAGKSVGVISYKSMLGFECDTTFAEWVARQVGAQRFEHFGNLRGTDDFEEVDCLVVFGRQALPEGALTSKAKAAFGCDVPSNAEWADLPILMKDGSTMTLESKTYTDPRMRAIANHWEKSESIQAIGRGRVVHSKPKDIYLFSNESLGSDVEISGFFDFEHGDFTDEFNVPDDCLFVRDKPADLKKFGFTEHHMKNNHEIIRGFFERNGFRWIQIDCRTKDSKPRTAKFFSRDDEAAIASLNGRKPIVTLLDNKGNPVTIQAH